MQRLLRLARPTSKRLPAASHLPSTCPTPLPEAGPSQPRSKSTKGYYNRMAELKEEELEETYVRGSGPGGQSINKTNISVSLVHKPTGIRVRCHETRSREQNRTLARRYLRERLDMAMNPGTSQREQKGKAIASKKAAQKRKHHRKKREKEGASEEASAEEEADEQGEPDEEGS